MEQSCQREKIRVLTVLSHAELPFTFSVLNVDLMRSATKSRVLNNTCD